MGRIALILIALLLGAWSSMHLGGVVTAGGVTVIFSENFEDSPQQSTCTSLATNPADSITGTPNCAYTTTPPEGTYSAFLDGSADTAITEVDWTNDFSEDCDNNNICRIKLLVRIEVDGNQGREEIVILRNGIGARILGLNYQGNSDGMGCRTQDDNNLATMTGIVAGTVYKVCMEFDLTNATAGVGTIHVDAVGDNYCEGSSVNGQTDICTNMGTSITEAVQLQLHVGSARGDIIFDDIVIEEE